MRLLRHICDEYGKKFSVKFNATKSAWLLVTKRKLLSAATPQFSLGGEVINRVSEFTHLGHIISDKLDDKGEISSKRNNLCGYCETITKVAESGQRTDSSVSSLVNLVEGGDPQTSVGVDSTVECSQASICACRPLFSVANVTRWQTGCENHRLLPGNQVP